MTDTALLADGFEDALIGYGTRFSYDVAVYSTAKCLEILMKRDGMTDEEALEYFEFNVTGAYVGENTPVFLEDLEMSEATGRIENALHPA
jgi:hypothetical protein